VEKETSGQSILTTGHIAATQWYSWGGASVHPHPTLTQKVLPWVHPSPNPKWHLDWFSRFCSARHRVFLYFTMGRSFSPQNCPFSWRIWTPSNTWFLGPTQVLNLNGISIGLAVFAGLT